MARPRVSIHPTEEFLESLTSLSDELGDGIIEVLGSLYAELERLKSAGWTDELEFRQIGGNRFQFAIPGNYVCEFQRETERDALKQPTHIHIFLTGVFRR